MAERKVDVFRVLRQLDNGQFDGYQAQFNEEERKEVDRLLAFPALRWMSASKDDSQHADCLNMVNEFVNSGYFDLGRHRELQWKLLCAAGLRDWVGHSWIAGPKASKSGKVLELLRRAHPLIKEDECELWVKVNGVDGVLEMARALGCDKDERKALEAELR